MAIDEPGPDRTVIAREELRRLQAALDKLPERYRQPFLMKKIDGLSTREIALRLQRRKRPSRCISQKPSAPWLMFSAISSILEVLSDHADLPTSFGPKRAISERACVVARQTACLVRLGCRGPSGLRVLNEQISAHMMAYWRLEAVWDRETGFLRFSQDVFRSRADSGQGTSHRLVYRFRHRWSVLTGRADCWGAFLPSIPQTVGPYETAIGGHKKF